MSSVTIASYVCQNLSHFDQDNPFQDVLQDAKELIPLFQELKEALDAKNGLEIANALDKIRPIADDLLAKMESVHSNPNLYNDCYHFSLNYRDILECIANPKYYFIAAESCQSAMQVLNSMFHLPPL